MCMYVGMYEWVQVPAEKRGFWSDGNRGSKQSQAA